MIPTWLQSIVLGLLQGATEFIPVSSSGHLVLAPYLFGWERPGLAFDVALHTGTAGAIFLYFRRELTGMLLAVLGRGSERERALYRRLAVLLVLASVPVGVAGLLLEDFFAEAFETPPVAASFLFVTAAVLVGGEHLRTRRVTRAEQASVAAESRRRAWTGDWRGDVPADEAEPPRHVEVGIDPADPAGTDLEGVGWRQALLIGLAQTLALFPGMSRSGTTIVAGMAAGLTREAATRFSFLLALPALVGASILSLGGLAEPGPYSGTDIALGVAAAFVAGYAAIALLVQLVARTGVHIFARYLVVAGALGWLGWFMIG